MPVSLAPPGVTFDLASPSDDAGLRQLFRDTPMEGAIEIAFLREPGKFNPAGKMPDSMMRLTISSVR